MYNYFICLFGPGFYSRSRPTVPVFPIRFYHNPSNTSMGLLTRFTIGRLCSTI